MLDPQTGIWLGTGILCAAIVLLLTFAIYKQYFGNLQMPQKRPQAAEPGQAVLEGSPNSDADLPPPYPGVALTAFAYSQTVDDTGRIAVEINYENEAPASPHVYEQSVQLETST